MLLVTGITGHTGRYFIQELIRNGYAGKIRCIVRVSSDTSLLDSSGLNTEKATGDVSDPAFLEECMEGVDTVLHIVNIRHSPAVINAAIKAGVTRAICVHTTGIFSKFRVASEEYAGIEERLKELVLGSCLTMTILRPTMIFGDLCDKNMSRFIKMIDSFRLFPIINRGKALIQPVNARDLGKAYYNVLMLPADRARSEYILSGEKPLTMSEAFRVISHSLNKKTVFVGIPVGLGVLMAQSVKVATRGRVDYVEKVQRMSEDRSFPHDDAEIDFAYNPEPFDVGIDREVRQYLMRKQQVNWP